LARSPSGSARAASGTGAEVAGVAVRAAAAGGRVEEAATATGAVVAVGLAGAPVEALAGALAGLRAAPLPLNGAFGSQSLFLIASAASWSGLRGGLLLTKGTGTLVT